MFMKKAAIAFIGVLACVLSVSCEDKLLDDEKKNSTDNSYADSYMSVLDSSFVYVDGILQEETHINYTHNGLKERIINKTYNPDGRLDTNEETANTYSDDEGKNYVSIVSRNGIETDKEEAIYSGSNVGNRETETRKYVKHGNEWFLRSDLYFKSENYIGNSYNVTYAICNGQRVAIQRYVMNTETDPATGMVLNMERIIYRPSYIPDSSDPDGLTISSWGKGSWRKTIERNNSQGKTLYKEELGSSDSITWDSWAITEAEYDLKGNLVYEVFSSYGKTDGKTYVKYSDDYKLISSYSYDFKNNGTDSVLTVSREYYYSDAGVLDSVVIVYDDNIISQLPLNKRSIDLEIYLGFGQNEASGAKCVVQFDSNGNPVSEKLYRMDENGDIADTACVHSTLTYDTSGRCTGYTVSVSVNGEWVEVENGRGVYDSLGREHSSHVVYTGLPKGAAGLASERIPTYYTRYESSIWNEYDPYGNVSYKVSEESYTRASRYGGTPRIGNSKIEEFYSSIKVK